jgi:lysyl-tRNA synthetase class 2
MAESTSMDWQPTAKIDTLRTRARVLQSIRAFFSMRDVLEVDTPVLSRAAATDVNLESFATVYRGPGAPQGQVYYAHTSPEFPMKRLLASGSGPIYQICKVFRQGESGASHNPEFTMLEWYRPHYDLSAFFDELEEFVTTVLGEHVRLEVAERLTYAEAFKRFARIDNVHEASVADLRRRVRELALPEVRGLGDDDRDGWLDFIMSTVVQSQLGHAGPSIVFDYPASQAALARINPGPPAVAERFEVFVKGVEIANGFHELTDADEQRRRFEQDRARRAALKRRDVPIDENLLAALAEGMPDCTGVAVGVDRLVMLATGARRIEEVIAFPFDRA